MYAIRSYYASIKKPATVRASTPSAIASVSLRNKPRLPARNRVRITSYNVCYTKLLRVRTPYGEPSGALTFGRIRGNDLVFLARHGYGHTVAPHEVNYRANVWALKEAGVEGIVSIASVGGIRNNFV